MNFITAEEKSKLEAQLKNLFALRRVITERIAAARALGDLRENGDYHAAREDQGLNEAKIRQVESRLASAIVADGSAAAAASDIVFLGATVKLREVDSGSEEHFRLVGEATGVISEEYIEVTPASPMGMALMKARIGETIRVDSRRGERRYEIIQIL